MRGSRFSVEQILHLLHQAERSEQPSHVVGKVVIAHVGGPGSVH
jgi:hypothetical protein